MIRDKGQWTRDKRPETGDKERAIERRGLIRRQSERELGKEL